MNERHAFRNRGKRTNGPCPSCHSKDNRAYYENGDEKCYGCGDHKSGHKSKRRKKVTKEVAEALREYASLEPANSRQSYLISKHLKGDIALRIMSDVRQDGPALTVPYLNFCGLLATYQRIYPDGKKLALAGVTTKRVYHPIGDDEASENLWVAEGWATGTTLNLAVDEPVFVAMGCENLRDVAKHAKALGKKVFVCSDTGEKESELARQAATEVGGWFFKPHFPTGMPGTDANDLAQAKGIKELRRQINKYTQRVPEASAAAGSDQSLFPEVIPWEDPVDGAELLSAIESTISRYVTLSNPSVTAVSLWIVMTYLMDEIQTAALLAVLSPEMRCGKTTLLTIVGRLVYHALHASNISPAAMFRVIAYRPTLVVDEADSFLGKNDELRGIINSGHTRETAYVIRCVGDDHTPVPFSTWAAKVFAAIGTLPPTLQDRAIIISMRRKLESDITHRIRPSKPGDRFEKLRRKATRWSQDNCQGLDKIRVRRPAGLNDRAFDNWLPLFQIAKHAGGDWMDKAVSAALSLAAQEAGQEDSATVLLLQDLRDLFGNERERQLATSFILNELAKMEDRPWPEFRRGEPITARQAASLLKGFGIKPRVYSVRRGRTARGYRLKDCRDAFERYCK